MNTTKILGVSLVAISLLGIGCNPFAGVQKKIEANIGESIGEKILEGSVGGKADFEIGGKIPENFPSAVPRYPGATIVSAVVMNEGKLAIMNFQTKDSAEAVDKWYGEQLVAAGFKLDSSIALGGTIKFYTDDKARITVQAGLNQKDDELTGVSIQYVVKDN